MIPAIGMLVHKSGLTEEGPPAAEDRGVYQCDLQKWGLEDIGLQEQKRGRRGVGTRGFAIGIGNGGKSIKVIVAGAITSFKNADKQLFCMCMEATDSIDIVHSFKFVILFKCRSSCYCYPCGSWPPILDASARGDNRDPPFTACVLVLVFLSIFSKNFLQNYDYVCPLSCGYTTQYRL